MDTGRGARAATVAGAFAARPVPPRDFDPAGCLDPALLAAFVEAVAHRHSHGGVYRRQSTVCTDAPTRWIQDDSSFVDAAPTP